MEDLKKLFDEMVEACESGYYNDDNDMEKGAENAGAEKKAEENKEKPKVEEKKALQKEKKTPGNKYLRKCCMQCRKYISSTNWSKHIKVMHNGNDPNKVIPLDEDENNNNNDENSNENINNENNENNENVDENVNENNENIDINEIVNENKIEIIAAQKEENEIKSTIIPKSNEYDINNIENINFIGKKRNFDKVNIDNNNDFEIIEKKRKFDQVNVSNNNFEIIGKEKNINIVFVCAGLIGSGKSTMAKIMKNIIYRKYNLLFELIIISSDEIRKRLTEVYAKKHNVYLNEAFFKTGIETQKEFNYLLKNTLEKKSKKIKLIFLDKNFPDGCKQIKEMLGKEDKLVMLKPTTYDDNIWPYSLSYVIQTFSRMVNREEHENLKGYTYITRKIFLLFLSKSKNKIYKENIYNKIYEIYCYDSTIDKSIIDNYGFYEELEKYDFYDNNNNNSELYDIFDKTYEKYKKYPISDTTNEIYDNVDKILRDLIEIYYKDYKGKYNDESIVYIEENIKNTVLEENNDYKIKYEKLLEDYKKIYNDYNELKNRETIKNMINFNTFNNNNIWPFTFGYNNINNDVYGSENFKNCLYSIGQLTRTMNREIHNIKNKDIDVLSKNNGLQEHILYAYLYIFINNNSNNKFIYMKMLYYICHIIIEYMYVYMDQKKRINYSYIDKYICSKLDNEKYENTNLRCSEYINTVLCTIPDNNNENINEKIEISKKIIKDHIMKNILKIYEDGIKKLKGRNNNNEIKTIKEYIIDEIEKELRTKENEKITLKLYKKIYV